jgi:hypothetical protein
VKLLNGGTCSFNVCCTHCKNFVSSSSPFWTRVQYFTAAKILSNRLPWQLNFVWWHLIFVDCQPQLVPQLFPQNNVAGVWHWPNTLSSAKVRAYYLFILSPLFLTRESNVICCINFTGCKYAELNLTTAPLPSSNPQSHKCQSLENRLLVIVQFEHKTICTPFVNGPSPTHFISKTSNPLCV